MAVGRVSISSGVTMGSCGVSVVGGIWILISAGSGGTGGAESSVCCWVSAESGEPMAETSTSYISDWFEEV